MQLTVPSKYPNSSAEQSDQHNSCVTLYTRVMSCLTWVPTASGYMSCRKILWYEVNETMLTDLVPASLLQRLPSQSVRTIHGGSDSVTVTQNKATYI